MRGPGKLGKHLKQEIEPRLWTLLERTYADARPESAWDALEAMCALFRIVAGEVAGRCGFNCPHGDDERVSAHLRHVRRLPATAAEMY